MTQIDNDSETIQMCNIAKEEQANMSNQIDNAVNISWKVARRVYSIKRWIERRLDTSYTIHEFLDCLPKGEILLDFARSFDNTVGPVFRHKIKSYRHVDNITKFMEWLNKIRFPKEFMFDSVDIYESKNMIKVFRTLLCLGNFLNQRNMYIGAQEDEHADFDSLFLDRVYKMVTQGYNSIILAIAEHDLNEIIENKERDSDCFFIYNRFTTWNAECYNLVYIPENTNSGVIKLLNTTDADRFCRLYNSTSGYHVLAHILLETINKEIEKLKEPRNTKADCETVLEKYKNEIIKFPDVYFALEYGKHGLSTDSILNSNASDREIFIFTHGLLEIDTSLNYSMTMVPLLFFFRQSFKFKALQSNVSLLTSKVKESIDPIRIYREMYGHMPHLTEMQMYEYKKIAIESLKDERVATAFNARVKLFQTQIDNLLILITEFQYPEYLNIFLANLGNKNNFSRMEALGYYFEHLVEPLFVPTPANNVAKNLLKIIFKGINIFSNTRNEAQIGFYKSVVEIDITHLNIFKLESLQKFIKSKLASRLIKQIND